MRFTRAGLVPLALVTGGIIIGVVVASNVGWLPSGTAGPEPVPYHIPLKSYERAASGLAKDQAVLLLLKRKGQAIYLTLRP